MLVKIETQLKVLVNKHGWIKALQKKWFKKFFEAVSYDI